MDPFTLMAIASAASATMSVVSAGAQIEAGKSQQRSSQLNAFNIETERERSKAEARQRHNDRLEVYRSNLSANIASFAAAGRDVGADRSVQAFLKRQKEIATSDTARSDFMGQAQAGKLTAEASAVRAEGRAAMTAARIGAFTTLANGLNNYAQTKI